jgi:hypothetical protein
VGVDEVWLKSEREDAPSRLPREGKSLEKAGLSLPQPTTLLYNDEPQL